MENISEKTQLVDIKKLIRSGKSKVLRNLPLFVINYIRKLQHEDDLNTIISTYSHLEGVEFAHASLEWLKINYNHRGMDKLKDDGRYIFVANHPLGGVDGLAFFCMVGEKFPKLKTIVNDLLMHLHNLRTIVVGVNKHGATSKDVIKVMDDVFSSNEAVVIFPAGLISRKINGKIMDLEWKKTFINRAIKYKREIVPVFISGRVSESFYRIARWREKLGIKTNIEMFFLSREIFRFRGKDINLTVGNPIDYNLLDKRYNRNEWVNKIKKFVYKLEKEPDLDFKDCIELI